MKMAADTENVTAPEPEDAMRRLIIGVLIVAMAVLAVVCLGIGRFDVPIAQTFKILVDQVVPSVFQSTWSDQMRSVIVDIRLPRVLASLLVGCALALSGCLYQNIFRNPLVSPDLLGVSNGACLGASVAILLHWATFGIQLAALVMGLVAVGITVTIPKFFKNRTNLMLILAGIVTSGFMGALQGITKYVADPDNELASIIYWTMGSFSSVKNEVLFPSIVSIGVILVVVMMFRWRVNLLALSEKEAKTFGVNVKRGRALCIVASTVMTAVAVCMSGTIGWVGLLVPHMGRLVVGEDSRWLLPASAVIGAIFMLLVDTLARNMMSSEIPLSILTGLIGAPLFIFLLAKQKARFD